MLSINGASVSEVADSTEARSQSLKSTLFTEHSNADNIKKRRTVADSVTSVGESGDPEASVFPPPHLIITRNAHGAEEGEGLGTRLADGRKARLPHPRASHYSLYIIIVKTKAYCLCMILRR